MISSNTQIDTNFCTEKVSIVIPCNHDIEDLYQVLSAIKRGTGTITPQEIVIVLSSTTSVYQRAKDNPKSTVSESSIQQEFKNMGISLRFIHVGRALPGAARNIGMRNSSGSVIALLDVKTIPLEHWLSDACGFLADPNLQGVWGSRTYLANSVFSTALRDAIFGRKATRSVAGTVFRRESLTAVGQFISHTPAGEDKDWSNRVLIHNLNYVDPRRPTVEYINLYNKDLLFQLRKWWYYYYNSRFLYYRDRDRWLAYLLIYIGIVLIAANWNYRISSLVLGSSLVVPHITKLCTLILPITYIFLRGIFIPLKRAVPVSKVFPFRFILLASIGLSLDLVKLIALACPGSRRHSRSQH
jgi:glycosyltransferase involved in cell wall biosynthesis